MRILLAACLCLLPSSAMWAECGGHGDRSTMLVTASWLAQHIHDPNLVILAVGDPQQYAAAHIPGSVLVELREISTRGDLTLQLPPMADLAEAFAKKGVNDDSRVVLYMTKDGTSQTARVYLTLDAMGLGRRTSILDGGMGAWQAEHQPVTTDAPAIKPGKITPCEQKDVIASFDFVRTHLRQPGVDLIDARDPQYYSGATPSRNRAGHIPGAASIPYTSVVDEQLKLKPVEALRQQYAGAGVKQGDEVVAYCHIGQQASMIYFVARYLGYDARLYDGSWEEWAKHPELPAEPSDAHH
jgi:thiosulfate/3-mercaptopyruvate sulfurtransferase